MEVTETEVALFQNRIYERFHIKGIFSNVSDMTSHHNVDKTLIKSGQAEITIFGKIAESLLEKVIYVINHVYISNYKANRTIETTDISVIEKKKMSNQTLILRKHQLRHHSKRSSAIL